MQVKGHRTDNSKLSYYNRVADALAGDYRKIGLELAKLKTSKKKKKKIHKSFYQNFKNER